MRDIIYYSRSAVTTGNFDDLMSAGRLDIATHAVIQSFFLSNAERAHVNLHFFFEGPPDPPKHLEICAGEQGLDASVSKKDVAGLLQRMLYQEPGEGKRAEPFPNCFVDRESIISYVEGLDRPVYLLDERGVPLRDVAIDADPVFVLGDHEGIPKATHRRLKRSCEQVSLGPVTYYASQSIVIVHNECDLRGR